MGVFCDEFWRKLTVLYGTVLGGGGMVSEYENDCENV